MNTKLLNTLYNKQSEVARFFNVSANTVCNWKKQGCPYLSGPPFDVEKIGHWILHSESEQPGQPSNKTADSLHLRKLKADVKIAEQKAELEAFKVALKTGKLVDAEDIIDITRKQSLIFRQEMMAMPKQKAHKAIGLDTAEQAEAVLREICMEVLERLSRK